MSVNGVTQNTAINTNYYGNTTGSNNTNTEQVKINDVAATVEISEAGRQEARLYGPGEHPFENFAEFTRDIVIAKNNPFSNSINEINQMIADFKNARAEEMKAQPAFDPFDHDYHINGVTYVPFTGSLEESLFNLLDGKARNSSMVVAELGLMLQGTIYNANATIEERAINRETAVRNAESIVKAFFDNSDEADAFMDLVRKAAANDILREKGYVAYDNSSIEPYRFYASPGDPDEGIFNAYALKHYGMNTRDMTQEMFREMADAFAKEYNKDKGKTLKAEFDKDFADNEKKVADKISMAIGGMSDESVNESLWRLLKAFNVTDDLSWLFGKNDY